MNIHCSEKEVWFLTGSQHLYGEESLQQVNEHSQVIAKAIAENIDIPVKVVFKPVLTTPDAIYHTCIEANSAKHCIGLIAWMHTFSPAKMWIAGLKVLQKPLAHLHTQYNRDIPWTDIDMDFMNLNQSAHGDREFGFIGTRMRKSRKVIVGFWQDEDVAKRLSVWIRAALAWDDWQGARFARFGDNMREVAVTEGDKVAAQVQFGYAVNGYAVGDLAEYVNAVSKEEIDRLIAEYEDKYAVQPDLTRNSAKWEALLESARIEAGMKNFLEAGGFKGFTTTFEDLHGLKQLPGLAVQRLMGAGYGFGPEGDWKSAALVRAMKVMSYGLKGGTSLMEDYTYHLENDNMKVLGAHMLEVCESVADGKPSLEIHPLSIGGKADPARLVFNVPAGRGLNATIIDMGNRFRLLVNELAVVAPDQELPKLPVARALWIPQPNFKVGAEAWILAGGAHHSSFSQAVTEEHMEDFSEIAGIEYVAINSKTEISSFKKELKWNELYYHLAKGI
ncbi:L-arabinose isomerase [Propionispora sp. 2/2-37]|uniref:L-arabinose isomerase n=1 Tax=Propionispora sp. 2/2-37 TaxID=1677858 RepID=UPI0006BB707F|nr:L-arabinose isomerase [Propionispora sp. 2/2-37]CUH96749.1 L-arabinose isomerase [Propionispora sp. 2/2-37]